MRKLIVNLQPGERPPITLAVAASVLPAPDGVEMDAI
jgi:hypothetical protein